MFRHAYKWWCPRICVLVVPLVLFGVLRPDVRFSDYVKSTKSNINIFPDGRFISVTEERAGTYQSNKLSHSGSESARNRFSLPVVVVDSHTTFEDPKLGSTVGRPRKTDMKLSTRPAEESHIAKDTIVALATSTMSEDIRQPTSETSLRVIPPLRDCTSAGSCCRTSTAMTPTQLSTRIYYLLRHWKSPLFNARDVNLTLLSLRRSQEMTCILTITNEHISHNCDKVSRD